MKLMCELADGIQISGNDYVGWSCPSNQASLSVCSWTNVFCSNGEVTMVVLNEPFISGSISSALSALSTLEFLDMSGSNIALASLSSYIPVSLQHLIVDGDSLAVVGLSATDFESVQLQTLSTGDRTYKKAYQYVSVSLC